MHSNQERITHLRDRKATLIAYMKHCIIDEDWHGVADAAMDIREIDREIAVRSEIKEAHDVQSS